MRSSILGLAAASALGLSLSAADISPASAETGLNTTAQRIQSGEVATTYAQYRRFGGRYGYGPRYGYGLRYYGRPYAGRSYRRGGGGAAAAGLIGGLAAGAIIGGAIASQQAQAVPVAPTGDVHAYCAQRFRSYDPESGTYLGYDGQRHPCP